MNVAATTDDTDEQTDTPAPPPDRPRGTGPVATAVSLFGELLITAGLILGLFVVYSLWWTNVVADRTADKQGDKVRNNWSKDKDTGPGALDTKDGIGFLHVPAMKNGEVLVEKGTETSVLNDGVMRLLHRPGQVRPPHHRQERQLHPRRPPRRPRRQVPQHRQAQEGRPDRLRDEGRLVRLQGLRHPSRDLEVQRQDPRPDPRGVRQEEGRPLHHPDDLHAGVHVPVPVCGVGRAGPRRQGGQRADTAEGASLTAGS